MPAHSKPYGLISNPTLVIAAFLEFGRMSQVGELIMTRWELMLINTAAILAHSKPYGLIGNPTLVMFIYNLYSFSMVLTVEIFQSRLPGIPEDVTSWGAYHDSVGGDPADPDSNASIMRFDADDFESSSSRHTDSDKSLSDKNYQV
ncbi:hypothetical protein C0995_004778 [Termitomyces sp. Mi166|nr:hypothetical protein C0995_004778 [Termitomyces sp. Mi166\